MMLKAIICLLATFPIITLAEPVETPDTIISSSLTQENTASLSARAADHAGVVLVYGSSDVSAFIDGEDFFNDVDNHNFTFDSDHKNYFFDVTSDSWYDNVTCALGMGPGFNLSYDFQLDDLDISRIPYTKEVKENNNTLSIVCYSNGTKVSEPEISQ
ncbi:uncharacterized protein I206_105279 [Kwoniella pini CBS 10737]|uniref:Uncharacterized protein n=1 Tax=Kwoniella pini CBS 10737 TaxID=1296096 RepID=A0A1B9I4M9_9TREE|nr:uncharacterized protein I206_03812 [Kwoniella pini CBS 10737]OCF50488.1 hypothetical protein I206_03812 [Kwoniella pini CBS 10737]